MKYPYIIIDKDIINSREIKAVLGDFTNFLHVGTSTNYDDGLNLILEHSPELVFLEIESVIKEGSHPFELIKEVSVYLKILPRFVLVTSGKQWAYEAIRNQAYDYLLKPLDASDLRKMILRLEDELRVRYSKADRVAQSRYKIGKNQLLCLKSYGDYRFIETKNILYLKADNNSTDIILKKGVTITAFKTLKHFEKTLPLQFVRIHNSYIINSSCISRIQFAVSLCFLRNTQISIPFSRTYKKNIYLIIQRISSLNH